MQEYDRKQETWNKKAVFTATRYRCNDRFSWGGGGYNCKNIGTMTLFLFGNFLWEKHPTSNYLESC